MTEAEWLANDDPQAMLDYLNEVTGSVYGYPPERERKLSDRKLRLFACAAFRACLDRLTDNRARECLAVAEDFADGLVPDSDRGKAFNVADGLIVSPTAACAAMAVLRCHAEQSAFEAWDGLGEWIGGERGAALLRDVAGNPFRVVRLPPGLPVQCHICEGFGGEAVPTYGRPVSEHCGRPTQERHDVGNERDGHFPRWCSVCWATFLPRHTGYRINKPCTCCKGKKTVPGPCPWLTPDVASLALAAYEDRKPNGTLDPLTLTALADALEEAGCPGDNRLMEHLRGWEEVVETLDEPNVTGVLLRKTDRPHVRGCWALDLLLGKE